MSNMSKVTGHIIGYLGSEPRLTRVGDKEIARTFYCVMRNLRWSDTATGERQEKRVVLPLVSWGRQAEADAKYLHKGSHVAIEFRSASRTLSMNRTARTCSTSSSRLSRFNTWIAKLKRNAGKQDMVLMVMQ